MKKVFFLCFTFLFLFCTKTEKKQESPVEVIQQIDTVAPVSGVEVQEDTLIFTVQIAALKNTNESLENLEGVSLYYENSLTKYRLGSFSTYQEAKESCRSLRKKYQDAFVQALLNDKAIAISEALQN